MLAGQPVTVTDLLEGAPGVVDLAGGRAERCPGQPIPPANVLIWRDRRRRAGDDPAERHRAGAEDLRRGRPARPVAWRASRRHGRAPPVASSRC